MKRKSKYCPRRKFCWDVGDCADCEFAIAFDKLVRKHERAMKKAVKAEAAQVALEFLAHLYFDYTVGHVASMSSDALFDEIFKNVEKIAAKYGALPEDFDPGFSVPDYDDF